MNDQSPRYEQFSSLSASSARVVPPPTRSKRKSYLIVAGLLLIPVAVVCCGGGGLLLAIMTGAMEKDLPTGQAERDVVIDIDDVELWSVGFAFQPDAEVLRKIQHFDGSIEVDYEYEHPVEAEPFYLSCSSSVEISVEDAEIGYKLLRGTVDMLVPLMGGEGAALTTRNDQFAWGDMSVWTDFEVDGVVIGHTFIGRKDERLLLMMLVGLTFEFADDIEGFMGPTLAALDVYDP